MQWFAVLAVLTAAWWSPGTALADSVSCGSANKGALANGVELPAQSEGYVVPEPWRSREFRYGTEELVGLISRAAETVAAEQPGGILGVADLSKQHGGACPGHQSHQSGRDADLLYYALEDDGDPMAPDEHMPYYTRKGRAYYARKPVWVRTIPERFFDTARNWALVKAMLTDSDTDVERIFVSGRIERWMIKYARQAGEDEDLIHRAQRVLHQPSDSDPHHDHMHVRIACTDEDVREGRCRANAPSRKNGKWRRRIRCPRHPKAES